ncbi:hemolysin D [Vulcanibacillus modesticaldus]|uniref:Hemolysin D n=1 Tax=Vulcanibacillus modesticaldus TaxID=337097 RepID=A0A1D2YW38_9BACI|nr:hemolysin III family protein [Vulcanibacillus modesticaldus]OEF99901.1 hemolysin D [Vulcanibacillus modesticaldus]
MVRTHTYTNNEEIANAITHGIGVIFSVIAMVLLIDFALDKGTLLYTISVSIYGVTMFSIYLVSTLHHSLRGKMKDLFQIFDHSFIYFFIAGTYTPIVLNVVKGKIGWILFGVVWGIAIFGTVFKAFFVKKFLFTSTILYILMGWMIVFAWKPLINGLPTNGVALLIIGGVVYTIGAIFYVWRGFPYHHAVWHLFVLAGSIIHFFAILLYAQ